MDTVSSGGFRLEFASPAAAREALPWVSGLLRDHADKLGQWGYRDLYGHWDERLVLEGATLSVDETTPVHHAEYGLMGTPAGESLFQRVGMWLAFCQPELTFAGESVFRSDGRAVAIYEPVEIGVTQRIKVDYDGDVLRFGIRLELALPRGHCNNPYSQHAEFFRDLTVAAGKGEATIAGETTDGLAYGCALVDNGDGCMMPAVCLSDPRGREVLVASASSGGGDLLSLPSWVAATTGGDLLVWQTGASVYVWDGIRVRRIVDG